MGIDYSAPPRPAASVTCDLKYVKTPEKAPAKAPEKAPAKAPEKAPATPEKKASFAAVLGRVKKKVPPDPKESRKEDLPVFLFSPPQKRPIVYLRKHTDVDYCGDMIGTVKKFTHAKNKPRRGKLKHNRARDAKNKEQNPMQILNWYDEPDYDWSVELDALDRMEAYEEDDWMRGRGKRDSSDDWYNSDEDDYHYTSWPSYDDYYPMRERESESEPDSDSGYPDSDPDDLNDIPRVREQSFVEIGDPRSREWEE
jgi:hypothetical protein